jgi:hypothetical protein
VSYAHAQVDTSLLEEKHQQQLRDLEEAMKSTWEEKARISQAHEHDRQNLLREQAEARKLLELHQENNWLLLEEKGDLGLSISRIIELFSGVSQTVVQPEVISLWSAELRDILKLEDKLSEQDTVVEVYRAALIRDGDRFVLQSNDRGGSEVCSRLHIASVISISNNIKLHCFEFICIEIVVRWSIFSHDGSV